MHTHSSAKPTEHRHMLTYYAVRYTSIDSRSRSNSVCCYHHCDGVRLRRSTTHEWSVYELTKPVCVFIYIHTCTRYHSHFCAIHFLRRKRMWTDTNGHHYLLPLWMYWCDDLQANRCHTRITPEKRETGKQVAFGCISFGMRMLCVVLFRLFRDTKREKNWALHGRAWARLSVCSLSRNTVAASGKTWLVAYKYTSFSFFIYFFFGYTQSVQSVRAVLELH